MTARTTTATASTPTIISTRRTLATEPLDLCAGHDRLARGLTRRTGGGPGALHDAHPRKLSIEPRVGRLVDRLTGDPGQLRFVGRGHGLRLGRLGLAHGRLLLVHHVHPSRASGTAHTSFAT